MTTNPVSIEKAILADVCLGIPLGRIAFEGSFAFDSTVEGIVPKTYLFRGEQLALMRHLYNSGDAAVREAVDQLVASAELVLREGPFSVVDKPATPEGAKPHDYVSPAKYWWPNPDTGDGLPYVRRDGEVNPECYGDGSDYPRLIRFAEIVVVLALAGFLTERRVYSHRAAELLRNWFLSRDTAQTPHFKWAQHVRGTDNRGRWAGLIEARQFVYICEAIRLLECGTELKPDDSARLRSWYAKFLDWLLTSRKGIAAAEATNNIALWYDLQCMAYADFVGRPDVVDSVSRRLVSRRLAEHIAEDGSLPRELDRANPYDYVAFSVAAMALISAGGAARDQSLWDYPDSDGRNFQAAHDWLLKVAGSQHLIRKQPDEAVEVGTLLDIGIKVRAAQRAADSVRAQALRAEEQVAEAIAVRETALAELEAARSAAAEAQLAALAELEAARNAAAEAQQAALAELETTRSAAAEAQQAALAELEAARSAAAEAQQAALAELEIMRQSVVRTKRSRSWRFTRPLRAMKAWLLEIDLLRRVVRRLRRSLSRSPGSAVAPAGRTDPQPAANNAAPTPAGKKSASVPAVVKTLRAPPNKEPRQQLEALRSHVPRHERELAAQYAASPLASVDDTFVLFRIIGNDLPPRHKLGQSRENVAFILENEPELERCQKRWVVNRIFDAEEEDRIIALLEGKGQVYTRIPFVDDEYAALDWSFHHMPTSAFLASDAFRKRGDRVQLQILQALYRAKNNYAMNNNGARNLAISEGSTLAKWVLPWDGNCFVTPQAWAQITDAVIARPHLRYFVVPMERVVNNMSLLDPTYEPDPVEEPQLVFRSDAEERFNPVYSYGRRPKVELFWRLGIPGPWDRWVDEPWDVPRRELSDEHGQFAAAGWVARMFSGVEQMEQASRDSVRLRWVGRATAILDILDSLDRRVAADHADALGLGCYSAAALVPSAPEASGEERAASAVLEGIVSDARIAAGHGTRPAARKSTPPDGVRYDRTRLQSLFGDTTALALASRITGDTAFATRAAGLIETCFVTPETRLNPRLRFSQARQEDGRNQGTGFGVIDMTDFYSLLDAVRLIETQGALGNEVAGGFRTWLGEYLEWLSTSREGISEQSAKNSNGTHYDLQVAAIASYLGDQELFRRTVLRGFSRIDQQFAETGEQSEELAGHATQRGCFFNLQGWMNLLRIARRSGLAPSSFDVPTFGRLRTAIDWLVTRDLHAWPYRQDDAFDAERAAPLVFAARELGLIDPDSPASLRYPDEVCRAMKARFHPNDGIPPYWNL